MRMAKKIEGRVATCSASEAKWSGALVPQQIEREKSELTEESTEGEITVKTTEGENGSETGESSKIQTYQNQKKLKIKTFIKKII